MSRIEEIQARRDLDGCAAHNNCLKSDVAYLLNALTAVREIVEEYDLTAVPNIATYVLVEALREEA